MGSVGLFIFLLLLLYFWVEFGRKKAELEASKSEQEQEEERTLSQEAFRKDSKARKKRIEELRRKQWEKQKQVMGALLISDRISDFIVYKKDFERNIPQEREYRAHYFLTLLGLFGNQCAKCGCKSNGIDLDHFIFPKSKGGNFMMLHKDGFKVNNAIPLCIKCNRSKGNRRYTDFFTDRDQLVSILAKNKQMTLFLNKSISKQ